MQRGRIVGLLSVGICCCTALTALMSGALAAGQKASRVGQTRVVSISPSPVLAAQTHGVRVGKQCTSPRCVGDLLNCFIEIGHSDGYGDTIRVNEAWDAIDPDGDNVRVPAVGNLPIFAVAGNTTCTVGGALPCLICAGGVACGGNPAISNDPGVVTFQQNQYTILPDDPTILEDQANVRVQDLCDAPGTQGCSMLNNRVQFTAATEIVACCGNNLRESDETCDGTDDAVCNGACRAPGGADACTCCGDGIVQAGEDCDDGNMVDGDGCNTTCLFACGDNDVNQSSETCDGTDAAVCNSACRANCTCCGDGIVQAGEDCDDGNMVNGDGCNTTCLYVCGDNDVNQTSETCDGTDAAVCNSACRAAGAADQCTCCGDGIVQAGEDCDDGNMVNGDGCNTSCLFVCGDNDVNQSSETCDGADAAVCNSACRAAGAADQCTCCGDGIVQAGEDCDDGNMIDGDGCNTTCLYVCGDNDVNQPSETCDGTDAAVCNSACRAAGGADACTCCGDGIMQTGEECDDGNLVDGDGCTDCVIDPRCGDGEVNQTSEYCDGGDAQVCNTPCRDDCTCCGDGIVQAGEDCDDGNMVDGDGCNTTCLYVCGDNDVNTTSETCDGSDDATCNLDCRPAGSADPCTCCGDGIVQAGEDCDDANAVNGDGCNNNCVYVCGDNDVNQSSEFCDGSDAAVCNTPCRDDCTCCGDGTMQDGEECDDGNLVDGDGCTDCVIDSVCGDNEINQASETCDGTDATVCNRECRTPGGPDECTCCGDGVVNGDEDCDDGNQNNSDGCNTKCFFACGDGAVNQPSETCDGDDAAVCNSPCRAAGGADECTCCGDGMMQNGEECDDGNLVDGDGCTDCVIDSRCGDGEVNQDSESCDGSDAAVCNTPCRDDCTCCGDGDVQHDEECDDGNMVDGDGCTDCVIDSFCGDNEVNQPTETCDGSDSDGCHRACRTPGGPDECTCCGDGIVNGDEDCDDGNDVNDDGCNSKCFFACGDGSVNQDSESCDGSDADGCNTPCRDDCTCCGDGTMQDGEQCDDGNIVDGDGCTDCVIDSFCGNNIVDQEGETCDGTDAEGCHRSCRRPGLLDECTCCGDGIVNGDEDCDDGNAVNDDGCDNKCFYKCGDGAVNLPGETCDQSDAEGCNTPCRGPQSPYACTCCGDGMMQGGEECDDGNTVDGDGCTDCVIDPRCGDGDIDSGETCDGDNDDTCNMACRPEGNADECTCCGDGMVQGNEECDDGNDVAGDGCSPTCTEEADDFAGCTPGFWKQSHHFQYWPPQYSTGLKVNAVFGVTSTSNPTLLKALSTGGGGEIAFLRHAVAALLNSAHPEVEYYYSTAQVISMVQQAYATGNFAHFHGLFEDQNELGCTVDKSNGSRDGDSREGAKDGR